MPDMPRAHRLAADVPSDANANPSGASRATHAPSEATVTLPRRRTAPNPGRVLNFTTTILPSKSLAEIQAALLAHGALAFTVVFDSEDRTAKGVEFRLRSDTGEEKNYAMEANWRSVRHRLIENHNREVRAKYHGYHTYRGERYLWDEKKPTKEIDEQAKKTAWRILKDAIEVMLNMGAAGISDPGQVFFGFATLDTGGTVYSAYTDYKALPAGVSE